jgi:hypothetical protein
MIKFFSDEGQFGIEIMKRRNKDYDEDVLRRDQVSYWMKTVKFGRTAFSNMRRQEGRLMKLCLPSLLKYVPQILISGREGLPRP